MIIEIFLNIKKKNIFFFPNKQKNMFFPKQQNK